MHNYPSEMPSVEAFSELFNARCVQLGLLSAPEIAQRIIQVQPAMGKADLARSVRNWQAARNVPRPDFYRIILRALEVEGDRELCAVWHRIYSEAKASKAAPLAAKDVHQSASQPVPQSPVGSRGRAGTEGRSNRAWPVDWARLANWSWLRRSVDGPLLSRGFWGFIATVTVVLIVASLGTSKLVGASEFGAACDRTAAAAWDPQRNHAVASPDFLDIRANAIDACEIAVRERPNEGRYWFQLGRAHDRDARWHGNYARAYWSFRRAYDLGYPAAALSLGVLYEDGHIDAGGNSRRAPDLRRAATFYKEAAAAGLAMGHYCHAISTLFGWSDNKPNPGRALISAEAAVAAGSNRALALVADLHAKRPTTRHVECSQEYGVQGEPQSIAWSHDQLDRLASRE